MVDPPKYWSLGTFGRAVKARPVPLEATTIGNILRKTGLELKVVTDCRSYGGPKPKDKAKLAIVRAGTA